MILNKTTEYALTILGYMATRGEEVYSAEILHHELNIPRRYLRRLLTELSAYGFLKSSKGRAGGFTFAIDLNEITILRVIETLEGTALQNRCILGFTCCILDKPCAMHYDWKAATDKMYDTLEKTSLADLRKKYREDASGHQTGKI